VWEWVTRIFVVTVLGLSFWYAIIETRKKTRLQNGHDALQRYAREVRCTDDNRYHITSCAICLETFANNETIIGQTIDDTSTIQEAEQGQEEIEDNRNTFLDTDGPGSDSELIAGESTNTRRPLVLPCSHVFCASCLDEYCDTTSRPICPICREPFSGDGNDDVDQGGDERSQLRQNTHSSGTSTYTTTRPTRSAFSSYHHLQYRPHRHHRGLRASSHARAQDMTYRLQRMHTLHPDVVDANTMEAVAAAITGENFSSVNEIASTRALHVHNTLREMQSARSRGSSGSSRSSFGGGRSSGGRGSRF